MSSSLRLDDLLLSLKLTAKHLEKTWLEDNPLSSFWAGKA